MASGAFVLAAPGLSFGQPREFDPGPAPTGTATSPLPPARSERSPQLTQTQREQLTSYQSKTAGWFTVAAGAALLAAGETWQIVRHYRWPVWMFWLLVVVMPAAAILNTAVLMISGTRTRRAGIESAPGARASHPARCWPDPLGRSCCGFTGGSGAAGI